MSKNTWQALRKSLDQTLGLALCNHNFSSGAPDKLKPFKNHAEFHFNSYHYIHIKWLNTNGTKKKRQNLLMAEATVNEIYLNGIKLLLQVDEINNALNILYFKAKRAGIKMRGAVKKINKAGALVWQRMYRKKGWNKRGFNETQANDDEKSRIKYWKRRKKYYKTMENKSEV